MATIETTPTADSTYEAGIAAWRQAVEERLRAENGWLTLTGLYWLKAGSNTVGSAADCDVQLPESTPASVGIIFLQDGQASLKLDGKADTAPLRDDTDPEGATRIEVGSASFTVIRRGDQLGVRVRDRENPARANFKGRNWYPVDETKRVSASYTPHPEPKTLPIMSVAGVETPMENPGYVEFTLDGHTAHLEAFAADEGQLWFVFHDTSAESYHGGRFLYAPLSDGTALLDFNRAYNPPCAFTPYATCPIPPQENVLHFAIEAGEKAPL